MLKLVLMFSRKIRGNRADVLLVASCLVLYSTGAFSMGILNPLRVCMFSEIEGVVTLNGEPQEGVVLKQLSDYRGKVISEEVKTNKEGRFLLSPKYTWSLAPMLFDIVTYQKILIQHNGVEVKAWEMSKDNGEFNGEVDSDQLAEMGEKIRISCELTQEDELRKVIKGDSGFRSVWGICTWNGARVIDHKEYPGELD